jgi:hypothetical protein
MFYTLNFLTTQVLIAGWDSGTFQFALIVRSDRDFLYPLS